MAQNKTKKDKKKPARGGWFFLGALRFFLGRFGISCQSLDFHVDPVPDQGSGLDLGIGLFEFFFRIHHDGTRPPGDGFIQAN